MSRPRRLRFEPLEDRRLLAAADIDPNNQAPLEMPAVGAAGPAADIVLETVVFVDGRGQEISAPVVGQRVNLRARYHFSDLSTADSFVVRFAFDGMSLESTVQGATGTNVVRTLRRGGWLAAPGSHTITVTVDVANSIAETNEGNNTFTFNFTPLAPSLIQKFTWPVAGAQSIDWAIENYLDADPAPGSYSDYRGGPATYNGHDGVDFAIANYAAMDRGVAVFAAADGTVVDAQDGHYDRWLTFGDPEPPSNFVIIDHGNDWQTIYFHLKRDSVLVQEGQHVVAGQQIGQFGGSGGTPLPQLHFEVSYRDTPVEPFLAPNDYFLSPRPYTFDAPRGLLDFGITNQAPTHEQIAERISDIDTFPVTSARIQTYAWAIIASLHVGDTWKVKYIQPNGVVFADPAPSVIQNEGAWQWYFSQTRLPITPQTGQWRTEWYINDQLVGTRFFTVGAAAPEIRVLREHALNTGGEFVSELLIDGRTTPIDFGSVNLGAAGPTQTFTVQNHGYANLAITGVSLPAGYSIAEPLSTTIAAGASDTFTVRLDSNSSGRKAGLVAIHSNDASEPNSSFPVEGLVLGSVGSLQGDYNSNGTVDAADYVVWRKTLGRIVTPNSGADGDGDGTIDDGDYVVWRANFGRSLAGQGNGIEVKPLQEVEQSPAVAYISETINHGALPDTLIRPKARSRVTVNSPTRAEPNYTTERTLLQLLSHLNDDGPRSHSPAENWQPRQAEPRPDERNLQYLDEAFAWMEAELAAA